jgi:uncharacterized membrane protein
MGRPGSGRLTDYMDFLRGATLVAATMTMGLMAGVFGLYSHTIMPGLRRTDDRTFVGAFQAIDRAIINPWFMPMFFGALLVTGLAAVLCLGPRYRAVLPWLVAAFALYFVAFVITIAVNVPLNDAIKAAGDPDTIDVTAVRAAFDEARWRSFNLVRTLLGTLAFALLSYALVLTGKSHS